MLLVAAACSLAVAALPAAAPPPPALSGDSPVATVVLLHGLGRTHRSMAALERALAAEGYRVVNLGYPSREHAIAVLVDTLAVELDACCGSEERAPSFVTHSLGGILLRAYQASHGADRIGRVVMLSPPNQGSEVVDRVPPALLRLLLGPAAVQLGTDSTSIVHELPPVNFELGIITGNGTLNPLFSWWLPGEDDGKVTVASAWVEGADEFLVVPYAHTWIMQREQVIEQVLLFLETGSFGAASRPPVH
jgi:pimeloyl-ACP methyl ester carboxylesterase